MMFARRSRSLPLLALIASPLLVSCFAPPMLTGADDGMGRDSERAVTLTLKALGGDRSEGPPVYTPLQPIRVEYKLKLGKFSGFDHLFCSEETEIIEHGQIKVSKEGAAIPATLHSTSVLAEMLRRRAKRRRLEPGETLTGVTVVNLLFDMTAEGTYRIGMSGAYQEHFTDDAINVEAEPITVKVKGYPL